MATLLICIVDDSADYCFIAEAIFQRNLPACSLRLFTSGQAFLDALPQLGAKPNLVIIDQHMPQLSGYQTLVALKQQLEYRYIPVMMMSDDATHTEIGSFYQAGAGSYLTKPLNFNVLKETLLGACELSSKPE